MIGKFIAEALGEGAFLGMLKHAWVWAVKMIGVLGMGEVLGKSVGEEIKKRLVDPKGWEDENYFALDLAEAVIALDKKEMISQAMKVVEDEDKLNGTAYARNFRIIVTFNDINHPSKPGTPAIPAKPAMPATPAVPATATTAAIPAKPAVSAKPAIPAVPATVRPGITILTDLANCNNIQEVISRIMAVGVMQDASSNQEKFLRFGEAVILPLLKSKAIGIYDSVDCSLVKMETLVAKRNEEFNNRPLWKKIFLN